MGASNSTPATPTVVATQAGPPSECPMHQKQSAKDVNAMMSAAPSAYPSECPMHQQAQQGKINPENMVIKTGCKELFNFVIALNV